MRGKSENGNYGVGGWSVVRQWVEEGWRGEIVVEGWNCGGEMESLECGLGVCEIWWYID